MTEEIIMLSIRDCLDYCDLTDDEIELLAEHEGIPDVAAAQMACGLVQTPEGVLLLTRCMEELLERAEEAGEADKARRARAAYARFVSDHPLTH
jgi:PP-loop superfamily ATP-utilizing enzyme